MSFVSQRVRTCLDWTREVVASVDKHRAAVVAGLVREGFPRELAEAALDQLAGHLGRRAEALRQLEHTYTTEQADDHPARAARDAAVARATEATQRLQNLLRAAGDGEVLGRFGLGGPLPTSGKALETHLENAAQLLDGAEATLSNEFGLTLDTRRAAETLRKSIAALAEANRSVAGEARELEGALARRDEAMAAWTEAYQGVGRTLEGLYRLAGQRALAERIRPTDRRARGEETPTSVTAPAPSPLPESETAA